MLIENRRVIRGYPDAMDGSAFNYYNFSKNMDAFSLPNVPTHVHMTCHRTFPQILVLKAMFVHMLTGDFLYTL